VTTYLVRPARPTDSIAVRRLAQTVRREFRVTARGDGEESDFLADLLWVIEAGRAEIVGSCGVREGCAGVWQLHSLNLSHGWRGFGLGRSLVEEALRAAQANGALAVECAVAPEFVEATALLTRLGFISGEMEADGRIRHVRSFTRAS